MATIVVREVDLPDLVKNEGFPLRRQGTSWGGNMCPSCGEGSKHSNRFCVYLAEDRHWRFKCYSCGIYGDAADFLALSRHISLSRALRVINGDASAPVRPAGTIPRAARSDAKPNEALKSAIDAMRPLWRCGAVFAYLRNRGIRQEVLDMAVGSGQLLAMPDDPHAARRLLFQKLGKEKLVEAGLMKPGSSWPGIVFRPLVAPTLCGYAAEFRSIHRKRDRDYAKATRYGRNAQLPWFFRRPGELTSVLVVEGFIDALSGYQMVPEASGVIGVPGTHGWKERWFRTLAQFHPDLTVMIGMDNDAAGRDVVADIAKSIEAAGLRHVVTPPPIRGGDWNEALVYI